MKTIFQLIPIFGFLLSTFVLFSQDKPNRVARVTVNAQSGKVQALNNENENISINYVKKGNRVEVLVTNIGANQWATIEVSQKDINITGDDIIQPINPNAYKVEGTDNLDLESLLIKKEEMRVEFADDPDTITKYDSILVMLLKQNIKNNLELHIAIAKSINDSISKMNLLREIDESILEYENEKKDVKKLLRLSAYYAESESLLKKMKQLKADVSAMNFVKYMYFTPEKEEIDLKVKINTLEDSKVTSNELYSETLITAARFKMFGSIGVHGLIYNDTELANRDSLIVSGDRTKFKPSFGTYLNATWRCNDFWTGFGFGTGIPINVDGDNDLTPNFNLFYTMIFQAGQSRMGFNLGMAVQRTSVLQVGYADGDNLGSASESVPVNQVWKPAFMFGVTYNLGGTDK